ncbi:hypothetical protein AAE478_003366 [Parahypoxylon ruwenzoriense]
MGLIKFLWSLTTALLLAFPRIAEATVDNCNGVLVSEALPVLIDSDSLLEHLQALQAIANDNHGDRVAGSCGHEKTTEVLHHPDSTLNQLTNLILKYIQDYLSSRGYYVEVQHFQGPIQVAGAATLSINGNTFDTEAIGWSPTCDFTTLPIVPIRESGCKLMHYPERVEKGIALVSGGGCSLSIKSKIAGKAGAAVLLLYEHTQLSPSFGGWDDHHIPSAKISEKDARLLLASDHPLRGDVLISTQFQDISRSEYGDEDYTLLVGTHTDSAPSSAGINDNASGIASLLEVATRLTKFRTNSRVKFAFWTAAESGLLGSRHWVSAAHIEELRRIRVYLDINMVGSPNGALNVYDGNGTTIQKSGLRGCAGAQEILEHGFHAQESLSSRTEINNRSDYASFYDARIPFAGLFSGADGHKTADEEKMFGGNAGAPYDANYHGPGDTIDNVNMTALVLNTRALAHAIGVYGSSLEKFPALPDAGLHLEAPAKYLSLITMVWAACWIFPYVL